MKLSKSRKITMTVLAALLFGTIMASIAEAGQKVDIGEVTDPTIGGGNGNCPAGYVHNDLNGDGYEQNGECWRGMIIKDGGVGIGTNSPQQELDVKATTGTYAGILVGESSALEGQLLWDINNDQFNIFTANSWARPIYIDGSDIVLQTQASSPGNVGIGTTSPQYKLDVQGYIQAYGYYTGDIVFQKDGQKLWRMFEKEDGLYLENVKTNKVSKIFLEEDITSLNEKIVKEVRKEIMAELEARLNERK